MPKITFRDVSVTYFDKKQETKVFEHFNASFEDGTINAVLGASGCGKTTLLKTMLDEIDYDGTIYFDEADIEKSKVSQRNIAYVSQNYSLYPSMNVFDNIAFPLKMIKAPMEEIKRRVLEIAKELQIEMCLTRKPKQISGGQQQRVALARALVKKPDVCLLDEPLSNLDQPIAEKILPLIKRAVSERKVTTLYVTHNLKEAMAVSDKIYLLENGVFTFIGTPFEASNASQIGIKSLMDASFGEKK